MAVFRPALFSSVESNTGALTPLVRFVWAGVNTATALGSGYKQTVVRFGTVSFW